MATSFTQTTLYFPAGIAAELASATLVGNVSNLGASQCVYLYDNVPLIAGQELSIPFQVAVPPPLLYISLANAADQIVIQTPNGLLISANAFTPGLGATGVYFQPSAGGRYVLYYKAAAPVALNTIIIYFQAVLENTIGQFINTGSIAYTIDEKELKTRPVVSQTIALNTTSAVPNTLNIDFDRYPVKKGLNVLATFKIQVTCSGVESWGRDYLQNVGLNSSNVQLIAGQNYSAIWYSVECGLFSGRYSVTIQQAGNVTLPATCAAYASSGLFPALESNTPETFLVGQSGEIDISNSISDLKEWMISSGLGSIMIGGDDSKSSALVTIEARIGKVEKLLSEGFKRNEEVHKLQVDRINKIVHMMEVEREMIEDKFQGIE